MTEETPGFRVGSKFYPFVAIEQWTRGDSILVHTLTRLGDELFDGSHSVELQSAFLAVAMAHAEPNRTHAQVIGRIYEIGLGDVEEVGFPDDDAEGDARPPDVDASTGSSSSPESGAEPSEASS